VAGDLKLDIVIRTYNRAYLVGGAIDSVIAADRTGLCLRILVVDNASTDNTPQVLEAKARDCSIPLLLLHEQKPGGQHALNRAIALCTAPVIAFVDDDERVDKGWLQAIAREFADPATDYIAGPCRPLWHCEPPNWLPSGYGGVLGIIDYGPLRQRFGPAFKGMLTQGNCAVRRQIFEEVGPYPDTLVTAEDRWLNAWLSAERKQGFYCPDFAIDHIMQDDRISKDYFRRWAAREGRDRAHVDAMAGLPSLLSQSWYWRDCAANMRIAAAALVKGADHEAAAFAAELKLRTAWWLLRSTLLRR
jgi:glycosyltransferase involved in cell wall biosynthesis